MMTTEGTKYVGSLIFAAIVFGLGFYALVLYDFALPELIQGAFISFMTLAVQWVFGEQLVSSANRRARQMFEHGQANPTPAADEQPQNGTQG